MGYFVCKNQQYFNRLSTMIRCEVATGFRHLSYRNLGNFITESEWQTYYITQYTPRKHVIIYENSKRVCECCISTSVIKTKIYFRVLSICTNNVLWFGKHYGTNFPENVYLPLLNQYIENYILETNI